MEPPLGRLRHERDWREEVLPRGDAPLGPWESLGQMFLSPRTWPREHRRTAFFYYLAGPERRDRRRLMAALPWTALAVAEAAIVYTVPPGPGGPAALAVFVLLVETLFLAPFAGFLAGMHAFSDIQGFRARMGFDTFLVLPIPPGDIVHGLGMRTAIGYTAGLYVNGLAVALIFVEGYARTPGSQVESIAVLAAFLVVFLSRLYALRAFADWAVANVVRASLLLTDPGEAHWRAFRDFAAWGLVFYLVPGALLVSGIAASLLTGFGAPGAFAFAASTSCFVLLMAGLAVGFLEVRAGAILRETAEAHRHWGVVTGEPSPLAPRGWLGGWRRPMPAIRHR